MTGCPCDRCRSTPPRMDCDCACHRLGSEMIAADCPCWHGYLDADRYPSVTDETANTMNALDVCERCGKERQPGDVWYRGVDVAWCAECWDWLAQFDMPDDDDGYPSVTDEP